MDARCREVRGFGVTLTHDRDGVAALEAYVAANRMHWSDADADRMCAQVGSFVGECLVAVYGGAWEAGDSEREPGVKLPTGDTAFPIARADKFLRVGADAGLMAFFDEIGRSIAHGGARH
jgi:hypothetical protein